MRNRHPLPRQEAVCDYCGSADAKPRTGMLIDEEGQESLPPAFRTEQFQFLECTECGLVYVRERPNVEDLDVYYDLGYKCFGSYEDRGVIIRTLANYTGKGVLKQLRDLMPASSNLLLDYGCGSGNWLAMLRRLGADFHMIGTDITEVAIDYVRKQGIEGYVADDTNLFEHVDPGSVGIIYNSHVIEHVPSPKRTLEVFMEALTPGGAVVGQTPNIASWGCRFFGDLWNQWHVPRHFVLFDHETLARHAESVGFEVVEVTNSLSGATQWAQSALVWWAHLRKRPYRTIHEPAYPFLLLACVPVVMVESVFGHTCHMDFVFQKPA